MPDNPVRGPVRLIVTPDSADDALLLRSALDVMTPERRGLVVQKLMDGRVIVYGMGELHLELFVHALHRLEEEHRMQLSSTGPEVAYRRTVQRPSDGEAKYAKQTGGRGQYGHVKIHLYPSEPGRGLVIENAIMGGTIPQEFMESVEEGIREGLESGLREGYPIDDVRVQVYDGSYHDRDSSPMAFRIAGAMAAVDAARKGMPALLEPIVRVEVSAPEEMRRTVLESLSARHATLYRLDESRPSTIAASARMADMMKYAAELRWRTEGRGTFTLGLERYAPCLETGDDGDDSGVGVRRRPN